MVNRVC